MLFTWPFIADVLDRLNTVIHHHRQREIPRITSASASHESSLRNMIFRENYFFSQLILKGGICPARYARVSLLHDLEVRGHSNNTWHFFDWFIDFLPPPSPCVILWQWSVHIMWHFDKPPSSPLCHFVALSRTPAPRVSRIIWMAPKKDILSRIYKNDSKAKIKLEKFTHVLRKGQS